MSSVSFDTAPHGGIRRDGGGNVSLSADPTANRCLDYWTVRIDGATDVSTLRRSSVFHAVSESAGARSAREAR